MNLQVDAPTVKDIETCAQLIWENEGRPEGQDKIHWSQAEDQLKVCQAHDHWVFSANQSPP